MLTEKRKGQATYELALVLPIFLFIIFGIVDFARAFHCWATINHMSVEAARLACKRQNLNLATTIYTSTTHASPELVTNEFWRYISPITPRERITWEMAGVGTGTDTLTISVTFQFEPWFPLAGRLVGGQSASGAIALTASAHQKKE